MEDPQIGALKRRTLYLLFTCIGLLICSGASLLVAQSHSERLSIHMNIIEDQRVRMDVQRARLDLLESRVDALKARLDAQGGI